VAAGVLIHEEEVSAMTVRTAIVSALLFLSAACGRDDVTATARAQARVNTAVNTDSEVYVSVRDGVATLTGAVSSDRMRARAIEAARKTDGVRSVEDKISSTSLTGGTVPAK
jgi:osmotically-inducible protein OsmY